MWEGNSRDLLLDFHKLLESCWRRMLINTIQFSAVAVNTAHGPSITAPEPELDKIFRAHKREAQLTAGLRLCTHWHPPQTHTHQRADSPVTAQVPTQWLSHRAKNVLSSYCQSSTSLHHPPAEKAFLRWLALTSPLLPGGFEGVPQNGSIAVLKVSYHSCIGQDFCCVMSVSTSTLMLNNPPAYLHVSGGVFFITPF